MRRFGQVEPVQVENRRGDLVFLGSLAAAVALAALCAAAPLIAARFVSPWFGVVVPIGFWWLWRWLGPRASPGFVSGLLCISGYIAILGTLLACLALGIRRFA